MQRFVSDIKIPLFTILFIFLGLLIYTKLFGPIPFTVTSIQTTKLDYFRVEGVGEAAAAPDTAVISLGITKTSPNVTSAQQEANKVMNTITDGLKNLGISDKDIKTTNYSVYPTYDYSGSQQTITGYTVTQNLQVNVKPIDKANQTIDLATKAGANIIGNISFTLNTQTKKELQEKARNEAVKNAKEKAESLAKIAGISLGKIIDIQEFPTYNQSRPEIAMLNSATKQDDAAPTEISPGETTISITVSLGYQLQ